MFVTLKAFKDSKNLFDYVYMNMWEKVFGLAMHFSSQGIVQHKNS